LPRRAPIPHRRVIQTWVFFRSIPGFRGRMSFQGGGRRIGGGVEPLTPLGKRSKAAVNDRGCGPRLHTGSGSSATRCVCGGAYNEYRPRESYPDLGESAGSPPLCVPDEVCLCGQRRPATNENNEPPDAPETAASHRADSWSKAESATPRMCCLHDGTSRSNSRELLPRDAHGSRQCESKVWAISPRFELSKTYARRG